MVFRAVTYFSFLIFVISCVSPPNIEVAEPDNCIKETVKVDLKNPYNSWFSEFSLEFNHDAYFNIQSNTGLTDAIHYEKSTGYIPDFNVDEIYTDNEPCINYKFENIRLGYYSSFFNYQLSVRLIQVNDDVFINVNDNGSTKYGYIFMNYNITKNAGNKIVYFEGGKKISDYIVEVETESVVLSNNIEYYDVLKITNNLTLNEGNNFDITTIYIDSSFGIIKFVQKSGDIWDVIIE